MNKITPVEVSITLEEAFRYNQSAILFLSDIQAKMKSEIIVSRAAWLIKENNLLNDNVLLVTNEKGTMVEDKLAKMFGVVDKNNIWMGNVYKIALKMITRHSKEARLTGSFHMLDLNTQMVLIKDLIKKNKFSVDLRESQEYINSMKRQGIRAKYINEKESLGEVYLAYEQACIRKGLFDFNELIFRACELLKNNPSIVKKYRKQFFHILINDLTLLNKLQYNFLELLFNTEVKVFALCTQEIDSKKIDEFMFDFAVNDVINLAN